MQAYPDSVVGTDSHTTMINALGVFGWGVGGIEAEAAMLGQPSSMLVPEVVGFRLHGQLSEGATATDLVLTVTEMLRKHGVVGKFVEFYGSGLSTLEHSGSRHHRQHGARIRRHHGIFSRGCGDARLSAIHGATHGADRAGRSVLQRANAFPHRRHARSGYSMDTLELDLGTVEPTVAGPKRPQDRVALRNAKSSFAKVVEGAPAKSRRGEK